MKCLSIQLQTSRDSSFSPDELAHHLRSFGRYPEIDVDPDRRDYVNLNLFTEDLNELAKEINEKVLNNTEIGPWVKRTAIIVCEGDQGWDDYLLLWHFNENEDIDEI